MDFVYDSPIVRRYVEGGREIAVLTEGDRYAGSWARAIMQGDSSPFIGYGTGRNSGPVVIPRKSLVDHVGLFGEAKGGGLDAQVNLIRHAVKSDDAVFILDLRGTLTLPVICSLPEETLQQLSIIHAPSDKEELTEAVRQHIVADGVTIFTGLSPDVEGERLIQQEDSFSEASILSAIQNGYQAVSERKQQQKPVVGRQLFVNGMEQLVGNTDRMDWGQVLERLGRYLRKHSVSMTFTVDEFSDLPESARYSLKHVPKSVIAHRCRGEDAELLSTMFTNLTGSLQFEFTSHHLATLGGQQAVACISNFRQRGHPMSITLFDKHPPVRGLEQAKTAVLEAQSPNKDLFV